MKREFYSFKKTIKIESLCTLFDKVYGPEFNFSGESHDFWELVYVIDGRVGITADDKIYDFSAGDVILHKPMEFHKIRSLENMPIHVFICSFKASGSGTEGLENKTMRLMAERREEMRYIIGLAQSAFEFEKNQPVRAKNDSNAQRFLNKLELFLLDISESEEVSVKENEKSELFGRIIAVLNEHITENISVDFVAEQCFISSSKLKKIFRNYTGMGVITYFNELKVRRAAELLREGYSVGETAERLNFSSQFYLSRVFKRVAGITPSAYKARLKKDVHGRMK